jgi:histone acetyltransferase MYST1
MYEPEETNDNNGVVSKKRKRPKGFDGELDPNAPPPPATTTNGASSPQVHLSRSPNAVSVDGSVNPLFTTQRVVDIFRKDDGSAEVHASVLCTLGDIAKATNLRVEDAAFALHECGLLRKKVTEGGQDQILISGALVEKIAAERQVKEPCLSLNHIFQF